jgi:hypothetical protein
VQKEILGASVKKEIRMNRLTNEEYETLAEEYAKNPPELTGQPGFISRKRQHTLVNELLDPNYARLVNEKASAMSVSPAEIIQAALKLQLAEVM